MQINWLGVIVVALILAGASCAANDEASKAKVAAAKEESFQYCLKVSVGVDSGITPEQIALCKKASGK